MNKEMYVSRHKLGTKVASVFLSAAMLATSFVGLGSVLPQSAAITADAATDYGLMDNIQDGNILHCFCWKYNDITAMLPEIAEAGFTSIQTSPPQATSGTGSWWWFYQPKGFYIGTSELGTKDDLARLCSEADKYGIKIIADVVANHLAGDHSVIQDDLKDSQYWHDYSGSADDGDRYRVTHGQIGMPDLNTEHSYVQQCVYNYIQELKSVGVDGIRFDAAKHIGLPSEGDNFWPTVTADKSLWYYGEILNNPGISNDDPRALTIMKEYTQYIGITDSSYGMTLRNAFNSGQAPTAYGNYNAQGLDETKLLYWGESHDTWSNNKDWGYSNEMSQNVIDRAYAIAASRSKVTALYFSRPSTAVKDNIKIGAKGSTHFTSPEVAAVNHFRNAMNGTKEYFTTGNNCAVVCRGKGAVIAAGSGSNMDVTVPNGGSTVAPGTYTDEITGSVWTVTASTISGHIGSSGIAVVYNAREVVANVSATPGDSTFTDSVTATLNVKNATSGTYRTSDGQSGTYTNGKTITFGSSTSIGSTVTLTLSATGENGITATQTYTYTKVDPNAVVKIYFDNSGYNWSNVYAYVYDESSATARAMAAWPGVKLTSKNSAGYYELDVDDYKGTGRVIFSDGSGSATNRYPADMKPGLEIGNTSMKFSAGNKWEAYSDTPVKDPTVIVDKASGTSFTTETLDITLSLANAASGTYSVDGGPTKTFTGTQKVTIGEGKIGDSTVTVETTAVGSDGTKKSYTFTYEKKYVKKTTSSSASSLTSYYSTNKAGFGKNKTISVDGDISDWDSSMIIAQGTANDDPRVYRPNSMYELPLDLYTLYGAYDDNNVYLMWEMTNVQDVVAPNDNYPLSQGILWQTQELPFFIAIDTGKSSDAIGNNGQLTTGGTIWKSGITFKNSFNRLISINTKGGNGPFVYRGDSKGLNPVEILDATTSKIKMNYGKGILSKNVYGINGAYGASNNRVVGDICNESAAWVDFNTKGHNSASMDFFYELSIPYSELGITKSDVAKNGIGVLLVMTSGKSGMDCLPYDLSMNDNADLDDAVGSQENNSFEKSDEDFITTSFARIGKNGGGNDDTIPLQVNFGTDKSAPQLTTTALTLKAVGYGGTAPYNYQFSVDGTVVKASNTTATYTWKPNTKGQHTIKCVITDATGATATVSKTFTAEGDNHNVELVNNTTINKTRIAVGDSIAVTGAASGGSGSYTYLFYYKKSGATKFTKFGSSSSATFQPTEAGTYTIRTYVNDSTSAAARKDFTVTVTEGFTNNSTISKTSIAVGSSVTVNGAASGGSGYYNYEFYYKKSTATKFTKFGSSSRATFQPTEAGTYTIRTYAKDSAGNVAAKDFIVTATKGFTNNTTISKTSVAVGGSITVTGAASGGSGSYTYEFYYKKSTATKFTKFGSSTTATFKPSKSGTYTIRTYAKDTAGNVSAKDFTVTATVGLTNNTTISKTSVAVGGSITVTGAASGGSGSYTYEFYYKKSTATKFTKFGSSTTATFKPTEVGTYTIRTYAKDTAGNVVGKDFTVTVTDSSELVNKTTLSYSDKIIIYGAATGGSGPYTYEFYYKLSTNSKYTALKASGTTATFTPVSDSNYNIRVYVKDTAGNIAVKDFTLYT